MQQNISHVYQLIFREKDNPGTNKSPFEIDKVIGILRSSARRTMKRDLFFAK